MSKTQETIARLRELERVASPAPWRWYYHYFEDWPECESDLNNNHLMIMHARNAIPDLLAEIDRLTAENLELKRESHLAWSKGHAAGWDSHITTMQSADLLPKDQKTSNPEKSA